MKKLKVYILACAAVILAGMNMASCSDDMPAESYYTFKGQMVSDYLKSNPDYSQFAAIVERAGLMDLLSAYGEYTCFAATNKAVDNYLALRGFDNVADIPQPICDTIARMHLLPSLCYTANFIKKGVSELPNPNMLRDYLPLSIDTLYNADSTEIVRTDVKINNRAVLVPSLMNDSVENGVVHTVNAIMEASAETVDKMLRYNKRTTIFYEALVKTGLADTISSYVRDIYYNPEDYEEIPGYPDKKMWSHNHWNYMFQPEARKFGFTIFAVPDDVIERELAAAGITTTGLRGLYDYAMKEYGIYYEKGGEWDYVPAEELEFNSVAIRSRNNPLNKLIAYHITDRSLAKAKLVSLTNIDTDLADPTEWYETLMPHSTMKVQKATLRNRDLCAPEERNNFFINRISNKRSFEKGFSVRGAMVEAPVEDDINDLDQIVGAFAKGRNGFYYYVDRILSYGEETRNKVFNDRMRVELSTLLPELMNNGVQGNGRNDMAHDETAASKDGKCYWFPKGYLKNVKQVGEGIFLYQHPHNFYWSYQGDEFNLTGTAYDISIRLLPFPTNQYEIRLGFCTIPNRGIGQVYFDGKPQGIPLDMRIERTDPSIGTGSSTKLWANMSEEERSAEQKLLKNNGYYRGPASVANYTSTGIVDGTRFNSSNVSRFYDNTGTVRKVICQTHIDGEQDHWLRFRSVYAEIGNVFMIDYIEIVPKEVYGVDAADSREDDL